MVLVGNLKGRAVRREIILKLIFNRKRWCRLNVSGTGERQVGVTVDTVTELLWIW
jgi:hypothetical protein